MNNTTLGIDFGTTKTMAAWVNPGSGQPETVWLGDGRNYIPTTVYAGEDGEFLFGEAADEEAALHPERYCRGFKMKLGSSQPALMVFRGGKPCTYTARQLTAAFLRYIRERCEREALMQAVDAAVITRPVEFSPAQVEDLRLAAEEAGFSRVAFITEPEAAGYAFCRLSPEHAFQHRALIVDWGGGTLDMAVVERSGEKVGTDRKFTAGLNDMGGERFDSDLWNHVSLLLQERNVDVESEKPAVRHAAQVQVHKLKESLSQRDGKELRLATSAGPTDPVAVSRTDFEKLIGGSVQKAADQVCRLAKETSPEMLLLVGGTSLIPLVRQEMERQTGLTVCQWQYTREAVAIGAALWSNLPHIEGMKEKIVTLLREVIPNFSDDSYSSLSGNAICVRFPGMNAVYAWNDKENFVTFYLMVPPKTIGYTDKQSLLYFLNEWNAHGSIAYMITHDGSVALRFCCYVSPEELNAHLFNEIMQVLTYNAKQAISILNK